MTSLDWAATVLVLFMLVTAFAWVLGIAAELAAEARRRRGRADLVGGVDEEMARRQHPAALVDWRPDEHA